jgi:hypothetical protein
MRYKHSRAILPSTTEERAELGSSRKFTKVRGVNTVMPPYRNQTRTILGTVRVDPYYGSRNRPLTRKRPINQKHREPTLPKVGSSSANTTRILLLQPRTHIKDLPQAPLHTPSWHTLASRRRRVHSESASNYGS